MSKNKSKKADTPKKEKSESKKEETIVMVDTAQKTTITQTTPEKEIFNCNPSLEALSPQQLHQKEYNDLQSKMANIAREVRAMEDKITDLKLEMTSLGAKVANY